MATRPDVARIGQKTGLPDSDAFGYWFQAARANYRFLTSQKRRSNFKNFRRKTAKKHGVRSRQFVLP
jgi:hypothetical protein